MAHFDHPREMTTEALAELEAWNAAGVTAVNQCPLIRGINDRPEVLAELWSRLSYAGCPFCYLFQGRPTAGQRALRDPRSSKAGTFFQQALACGSGLASRARFVMSHVTGKIESSPSTGRGFTCATTRRRIGRPAASSSPSATTRPAGSTSSESATGPAQKRRCEQDQTPWAESRVPLTANSPLQLNDLGQEIAAEIEADKWTTETAPALAERAADEPPYNIDAVQWPVIGCPPRSRDFQQTERIQARRSRYRQNNATKDMLRT